MGGFLAILRRHGGLLCPLIGTTLGTGVALGLGLGLHASNFWTQLAILALLINGCLWGIALTALGPRQRQLLELAERRTRQLRYRNALLHAQQALSPDGILTVDHKGRPRQWNRRFVTLWGLEEGPTFQPNTAWIDVLCDKLQDAERARFHANHLQGHPTEVEAGTLLHLRNGRILERHSQGLWDHHGHHWGRVWFFRDVTRQKRLEERLLTLATVDALTGTLNRREFFSRSTGEWQRSRRRGTALSLLMIDVDHFKHINDRYGHATGDQTLRVLGKLLHQALRPGDIIGRLGGEEFAVALPDTHLQEAVDVAERLRQMAAQRSVAAEGCAEVFYFTLSVGVAECNGGDVGVEAALTLADQALYAAKACGRNRVQPALQGPMGVVASTHTGQRPVSRPPFPAPSPSCPTPVKKTPSSGSMPR
ncbi:MAG: GGDEF domain-containing protein [Candidatus Competibacterales bacterium]